MYVYMSLLGLLLKNEQYVEKMLSILERLHGYDPYMVESDQKRFLPLAFCGDQLTVALAHTAQEVRVTSPAEHALSGFKFLLVIGITQLILWR